MHANKRGFAAVAFGLLCAIVSATAVAQTANGTYMVEGGSYSITVEQDGDSLVVVEPNKRSEYVRQPDGSFHFYNPNTDATYGIRVLDERTIEAFKPFVDGNAPTRLVLMGGGGAGGGVSAGGEDRFGAMAEQYAAMIESDPDNVQSWTACAAVAMKRSMSNDGEADAYAAQMAEMMRMMDAASSPCPEVIPNW